MADGNGSTAGGRRGGPRCVALLGPFASGKTTLLEAILERTGAIPKAGTVGQGTTVGDAAPEARAHRMGVEANIADCEFMGERFTFIDCPGSVELAFEAEPVLAGVDMAVVVCEADEKKLAALQVTLKQLDDRGVPHVLFLNKIDKAELDLRTTLELLQGASRTPLVLRQIPIWKDGIAIGLIDLALERAHVFREHSESHVVPIADADAAREVEARYQMLEKLADYDDHLMEELLSDIAPPRDEVFQDLRREMRDGLISPVFIGSAERGNGVTRLLKAIRHDGPSIEDTRERLGLNAGSDGVVQVMKTFHTQHGGKMSIARVLAGKVSDGTVLYRAGGAGDRISGIYRVFGKDATKRGEAVAGETVGLAKVEVASTGDTLTTAKAGTERLVTIRPPAPVIGLAVSPTDRKDEVKLSQSLTRIAEEDPSLAITHDAQSGETLVEGQGEMHLRVAFERLTAKFGVTVETRPPVVPYRETIKGKTSVRGRHKKQSGGHGQFGDVVLEIEPLPRGSGFVFSEAITGGVVPRNYIPAVEEGVAECLKSGALGFRLVDIGVKLVDGSYHAVDSSDQAFKTAAQIGMREGLPNCAPVLLEPILKVEIATPSEATPRINQIVTGRRGQLLGFDARPDWPGWDCVQALIPQAEMGNLIVEIRSATAGVGTFTTVFDHLAELTGHLAAKVLERQKAAHAA